MAVRTAAGAPFRSILRPHAPPLGLVLLGLALTLAFVAGASRVQAPAVNFSIPLWFGSVGAAFCLDMPAAWFLLALGLAAGPVCLYLPGYMEGVRARTDMRLFWGALTTLLASMALVVMAANALTFLVTWELMSLSSFLLVGTDYRSSATRDAALLYLGATRISTGFLAGAFLWAHALTGSWDFAGWHLHGAGPVLLLVAGLGIKAGLWPVHLWLPVAHPTAPAPVSALMSGLMVKVPLICLIRYVSHGTIDAPWLGTVLVGLGAASAFWGLAFALIQHDLKRLLAYSTVENVGLIVLAVGTSAVAQRHGLGTVAALAMAAAFYHLLNHSLFKTLLFLGAGAIDHATGTRDLEKLGGLGHRMPTTFACFVVGSAAICALPPLNGFASEWTLYQGMLGLALASVSPGVRFLALLLVGLVALVGAMALACFLKATAVAFLGRPRSEGAAGAHEGSPGMGAAQGMLAAFCLLFGLGAPVVLPLAGAPDAWTVPMATLVVLLAVTALAVGAWLERQPARVFVTWECGFGDLSPRAQVTATSFVQPVARLFGALFRYAIHLRVDGANRRLFPESVVVEPMSTEPVLESSVYRPLGVLIDRLGGWVLRLQAGSIHLYLLTMLMTLVVLLVMGRWNL